MTVQILTGGGIDEESLVNIRSPASKTKTNNGWPSLVWNSGRILLHTDWDGMDERCYGEDWCSEEVDEFISSIEGSRYFSVFEQYTHGSFLLDCAWTAWFTWEDLPIQHQSTAAYLTFVQDQIYESLSQIIRGMFE